MNEIERALSVLERKSGGGEVPPQGAQSAGKRALELIKDGRAGSNFTGAGRARASQLARGERLSEATIRRMHTWHTKNITNSSHDLTCDVHPLNYKVWQAENNASPAETQSHTPVDAQANGVNPVETPGNARTAPNDGSAYKVTPNGEKSPDRATGQHKSGIRNRAESLSRTGTTDSKSTTGSPTSSSYSSSASRRESAEYVDVNSKPGVSARTREQPHISTTTTKPGGTGESFAVAATGDSDSSGTILRPLRKPRCTCRSTESKSRHVNDKKPGWSDSGKETPGYVAWLAWGGDAGAAWARKMVKKFDADKKSLNLVNHLGEQASTVEEVAALNGISNVAAAYGILGLTEKGDDLWTLAQKAMHAYRGEHSGDIMIAFELEPEFKRQLALPDGDDPGELHITLGYFGEITNTKTQESMHALCTKLAASLEPMEFTVSGIARFSSEEGDDALVALVDHPELPAIYCRMQYLANRLQVNYTPTHGYTPHITLGWLDREDSMPLQRFQPIKARIGAIALYYGNDRRDYHLGWTGGKLGDQVKDVHAGNGGRRKTKKLKPVRRARMLEGKC